MTFTFGAGQGCILGYDYFGRYTATLDCAVEVPDFVMGDNCALPLQPGTFMLCGELVVGKVEVTTTPRK